MDVQGVGGVGGGLDVKAMGELQKQAGDAALVSTTLNTMNTTPQNTGNADYDFQKSVLMADAVGKGAGLDTLV